MNNDRMPGNWPFQWPETGLTPAEEVKALRRAIQTAIQLQWSIQDDRSGDARYIGGTKTMAEILERETARELDNAQQRKAAA